MQQGGSPSRWQRLLPAWLVWVGYAAPAAWLVAYWQMWRVAPTFVAGPSQGDSAAEGGEAVYSSLDAMGVVIAFVPTPAITLAQLSLAALAVAAVVLAVHRDPVEPPPRVHALAGAAASLATPLLGWAPIASVTLRDTAEQPWQSDPLGLVPLITWSTMTLLGAVLAAVFWRMAREPAGGGDPVTAIEDETEAPHEDATPATASASVADSTPPVTVDPPAEPQPDDGRELAGGGWFRPEELAADVRAPEPGRSPFERPTWSTRPGPGADEDEQPPGDGSPGEQDAWAAYRRPPGD